MILSDRRIPVNMSSSISGLRMHRLTPHARNHAHHSTTLPPTKQIPAALLAEERSLPGVETG